MTNPSQPSTPLSPDRPRLGLVGRLLNTFQHRHDAPQYRTRFVLYSMVVAQIISVVLVLLGGLLPLKIIPIAAIVCIAAVAQYVLWWLIQQDKLGTGSSGRKVGKIVGIPMVVWSITVALVSLVTTYNILLTASFGSAVILLSYAVIVNSPVWLVEIRPGEILLSHAPDRPERNLMLYTRKPLKVPPTLNLLLEEIGLKDILDDYFEFNMPPVLAEDVRSSWENAFQDNTQKLQEFIEVLKPSFDLTKKQAGQPFAPLHVFDGFLEYMKGLRRDDVIWLRPRDPYYTIWTQNEFISITTTVQNILTVEKLQFDLSVSFLAFADPEKIKSPASLNMLAQSPTSETLKGFAEYMLNERVNQAALHVFNNRSYLEAFSPQGIDEFRRMLAPYSADSADAAASWGLTVYEPSIKIIPIMPEAVRNVIEADAISQVQARTNLAQMRQYLQEIEKVETDPEIKKYLELQIVAFNAVDSSRGKGSRHSRRSSSQRVVVPPPGGKPRKSLGQSASQSAPPQAAPSQGSNRGLNRSSTGPASLDAERGPDGVYRVPGATEQDDDPDI